jgi:hypothetical protein
MKQGHNPLANFLPSWIAVAKLTEFEDIPLISHLKRALHPDIIWRLVVVRVMPTTFAEIIEFVRQCNRECRELNADYYRMKSATTTTIPLPARNH